MRAPRWDSEPLSLDMCESPRSGPYDQSPIAEDFFTSEFQRHRSSIRRATHHHTGIETERYGEN